MGYRWAGFRKVRRQVCRRVRRRYTELGLDGFESYARLLEADPDEWPRLDDCCRITISRFYRGRGFWQVLGQDVLPRLYERAAERDPPRLFIWSAGCGAGEEPYTTAMLLLFGRHPLPERLTVEIVATDLDSGQLERARQAVYPESSLRDLPPAWRELAFARTLSGDYRLREQRCLESVRLVLQDIRSEAPEGSFDLILCRNLAFTYFDAAGQEECLHRLLAHLEPWGRLAIGEHEALPAGDFRLHRHGAAVSLFDRA